jgi:serine/threonine-protein kinase
MEKEFLGNFKIIRKVGEGGMAVAFLAHHKEIPEHRVILKLLKDPRHGEKFKKEANNLAKLNDHHNICRIYDYFNDGDRTVIVMEYIEGATLKDVIEAEEKLPLNLFLKLGVDLIRIMKYAHDRRMYHRDLKPGNIMVDKQGELKVIDFGIAKDATDPSETAAGIFSGTPLFAPIEQFSPLGGIDWAKADIYAIGTTLYLMITGRMPFDGKDWDEYSENKRLAEPYPPSKFNMEITKKLDVILLRSIARLPQDRYNSLGEMLTELEQLRTEKVTEPSQMDKTVDVAHYPAATQGESPGARWGDGKIRDLPKKSRKRFFISIAAVIALITTVILLSLRPKIDSPESEIDEVDGRIQNQDQVANLTQPKNSAMARGTLEITSNTPADMFVEDSLIGRNVSSKVIELDSGKYFVRLESQNTVEKSQSKSTSIRPGQVEEINFQFHNSSNSPAKPVLGAIKFDIDPEGDIYMNDKRVAEGQSQFVYAAAPGEYQVRIVNISIEIDSTISEKVKLGEGESKNLFYRFKPKENMGYVRVGSWPPKATIFINEKEQGQPTPYIFKLPAGNYNVRVWVKDRDLSQDSNLVVIAGDTVKFAPEFE